MPPEFFLDRNLGRLVAEELRARGWAVHRIVDVFPADAQDTIPYMEPPYWYYPVRQSLGAALLKTGHPQEAEKEFLAALDRARDSAWALFGLDRFAVLQELRKISAHLIVQSAGDLVRIAWKYKSMEDCIDGIALG